MIYSYEKKQGGDKLEKSDLFFYECYEKYNTMVYRFVISKVRDEFEAKDLTQDVFLDLHKQLPELMKDERFVPKAWLIVVTRNKLCNYFDKKKKRAMFVSYDELAEKGMISVFDQFDNDIKLFEDRYFVIEEIKKIISSFQDSDREMFHLRFMENYSYKELADHFGKKETYVRVRLHRIITRIRKEFKN